LISLFSATGEKFKTCKKEYCSYFKEHRDEDLIDEERVKQILKSKAFMTIKQMEWEQD